MKSLYKSIAPLATVFLALSGVSAYFAMNNPLLRVGDSVKASTPPKAPALLPKQPQSQAIAVANSPLAGMAKRPQQGTNNKKFNPRTHLRLPGTFRGDWGETLVYSRNDRVNHENGAYLSLTDDNQGHPPAISQGYWRLVFKFKAVKEQNCLSPALALDMAKCDFTGTSSLKDKDLRGALLTHARLNGELGSADLSGANLSGAAIIGSLVISPDTRLDHANLSGLQSDGNNPLIAESANLSNTNLAHANLYGARLQHTDLSGAKLPEAMLTGSQLDYTHFDNADLNKSVMAYANLTASSLTNAVMTEVDLEQANLSEADLSNSNLQQANFAGSQLTGANFSGADLRGVNFSAAQGADTAITDSQTDFTSAICPDGVTVDGIQATTCLGHGF